jgi:hypothetical protein
MSIMKVQNLIQIQIHGDIICSMLNNSSKGILVQIDFQDSECGISMVVPHEDFRDYLLFVEAIGVPAADGQITKYKEFIRECEDEINNRLNEFFVGFDVQPNGASEFEACSPKSEDMYDCIGFPEYANVGGHQRPLEKDIKPLNGFLDLDVDHLQNYYANA